MNGTGASPLAVCVWPEPGPNVARTASHPNYVFEILDAAGVCYNRVDPKELASNLPNIRVLLSVGDTNPEDELRAKLESWVKEGGAWLSVAGVCNLPELFGVEIEYASISLWAAGRSNLGEGYLKPEPGSHPVLQHLAMPLHYFNGTPVKPAGGNVLARIMDAHQRQTERAGVVENRPGKGRCMLIAPDITGSVIRIQQGVCITRDGVPAPDGTGPVCDYVLKSDDGQVLDWIFDREPVPGAEGFSAFLQPVADQWREMLIRAILYLAREQEAALPLLWFYPRNLPAIGHLSHDSDNNESDKAMAMLDAVREAEIKSTWCVHVPGYAPEIVDAIRGEEHELAMHYDAMSDGTTWDRGEFHEHFNQLTELFGGQKPTTNKNHYLRWEGDVEFYEWCLSVGITIDESKGASKTGEAGFNFGACRPFFPVAPDGSLIDVLEQPTYTQDLLIFAPQELAEPLLKAVYKHWGVAHFLFHPAHIMKPGVKDALVSTVKKGKQMGMEWWTAKQINHWERARRKVQWSSFEACDGKSSVKLHAGESLEEATILWLVAPSKRASINGEKTPIQRTQRFGFEFESMILNAAQGGEYTLEVESR